MRRELKSVLAALIVVASFASLQAADEVSLRWALAARPDAEGELVPVREDTQLGAGTQMKFLVEPIAAGAVYLVFLDSSDQAHVLYRGAADGDAAEPTYIPAGRGWFELDASAGLETFFLIAAEAPLADLDQLLDALEGGADNSGEIVAEIRKLHRAHRDFAKAVEKPMMIGGRRRGGPDEDEAIDRLALEVAADGFYAKTITIEH